MTQQRTYFAKVTTQQSNTIDDWEKKTKAWKLRRNSHRKLINIAQTIDHRRQRDSRSHEFQQLQLNNATTKTAQPPACGWLNIATETTVPHHRRQRRRAHILTNIWSAGDEVRLYPAKSVEFLLSC